MLAANSEQALLAQEIAKCWDDPLRYVLLAFPWGVKGTALEHHPEGPDKWQRQQLNDIRDHIRTGKPIAMRDATTSGHGIGKAQPYSLELDTPIGKRVWGELQIGDYVFGSSGKPVKIQARHEQGIRPIFKVTFSDGSSTFVDESHTWAVKGRQQRRNGEGWIELTTSQIVSKGVKRSNGCALARQWEIPKYRAVEYTPALQMVEPYLMGLWLGDGSKSGGSVTSADDEVFDLCANYGYALGPNRHTGNGYARTHTLHGLTKKLRKEGVFGCTTENAFVPENYKKASIKQRLAVLQGLLDSDGWVEKSGTVAFGSISKQLASDVAWLARSLGLIARIKKAEQKWYRNANGKKVGGRPFYKTTITWDGLTEIFRLSRKQEKLVNPQERYKKRWIESIEYSHDEQAMCISVDADDQLYLTNDFIVTHNSAETAWIILWFVSTRPNCAGRITAGTQAQLTNTTWRELSVWHKLAINKDWFKWTATRFYAIESPETWGVSAIPWSEQNSDAFAGLHAEDVLVIYDEASTIADVIWEVTEGAMTTPGAFWFVFGNPVRNTGRFRECFRAHRHRWSNRQIDSRECRMTNKEEIRQWEEDYGEDSDFFRVRVKGMFPRASSTQLISEEVCENARLRVMPKRVYERYPVLLGVDVARYGDDRSVIIKRQGPVAFAPTIYREISTMELSAFVFEMWQKEMADAVLVDGIGVGAGVVDRLEELGVPVVDVQSAATAEDKRKYKNCRSEIWGRMADWMEDAVIPDDKELIYELTAPEYGYNANMQICVESTDDIKKRLGMSPDKASALAMTMADSDKIARALGANQKPRARRVKSRGLGAWT